MNVIKREKPSRLLIGNKFKILVNIYYLGRFGLKKKKKNASNFQNSQM